jgi:hypothetical protein
MTGQGDDDVTFNVEVRKIRSALGVEMLVTAVVRADSDGRVFEYFIPIVEFLNMLAGNIGPHPLQFDSSVFRTFPSYMYSEERGRFVQITEDEAARADMNELYINRLGALHITCMIQRNLAIQAGSKQFADHVLAVNFPMQRIGPLYFIRVEREIAMRVRKLKRLPLLERTPGTDNEFERYKELCDKMAEMRLSGGPSWEMVIAQLPQMKDSSKSVTINFAGMLFDIYMTFADTITEEAIEEVKRETQEAVALRSQIRTAQLLEAEEKEAAARAKRVAAKRARKLRHKQAAAKAPESEMERGVHEDEDEDEDEVIFIMSALRAEAPEFVPKL